jgi:hypothetical protein
MGLISYTLGIPNAPNNPSNDQPNMLTNNNNSALIWETDHIGFNDNFSGIHNVITFFNQGTTDPAAKPGPPQQGQLYTKTVTPSGGSADVQLFYESALAQITQLTGPNAPVQADNGYIWIGPILLQWGFINSTSSSYTPLLFATANIPFPNNCFDIWTQPYATGSVPGSQATVAIRSSSVSKTGFQWAFVTNSGSYLGFFWTALGN